MKTSARPACSSASRVRGGATTSSVAWRSVSRISGSMKVPAATATTLPGRSMSSQRRITRLSRVVTP
jgi:hypothetical protein